MSGRYYVRSFLHVLGVSRRPTPNDTRSDGRLASRLLAIAGLQGIENDSGALSPAMFNPLTDYVLRGGPGHQDKAHRCASAQSFCQSPQYTEFREGVSDNFITDADVQKLEQFRRNRALTENKETYQKVGEGERQSQTRPLRHADLSTGDATARELLQDWPAERDADCVFQEILPPPLRRREPPLLAGMEGPSPLVHSHETRSLTSHEFRMDIRSWSSFDALSSGSQRDPSAAPCPCASIAPSSTGLWSASSTTTHRTS
eukprot:scaffold942_cov260-Pinguiococcus_pyrenoidosus.AAC.14